MEVRDGQQVIFPGLYPSLCSQELAGGTMSVSAGVVGEGEFAAVIAFIEVSA